MCLITGHPVNYKSLIYLKSYFPFWSFYLNPGVHVNASFSLFYCKNNFHNWINALSCLLDPRTGRLTVNQHHINLLLIICHTELKVSTVLTRVMAFVVSGCSFGSTRVSAAFMYGMAYLRCQTHSAVNQQDVSSISLQHPSKSTGLTLTPDRKYRIKI